MAREDPADVAISAVTLSELVFGAARSRRPAAASRVLDEFRDAVTVVPLDETAAWHAQTNRKCRMFGRWPREPWRVSRESGC